MPVPGSPCMAPASPCPPRSVSPGLGDALYEPPRTLSPATVEPDNLVLTLACTMCCTRGRLAMKILCCGVCLGLSSGGISER